MKTSWSVETTWVPTWKLTLLAPAGTSTCPCCDTLEKLVDNATSAPVAGARPLRVTVPVVGLPPITGLGLKVRLVGWGGCTVRGAEVWLPAKEAVIVTLLTLPTGFVAMAKGAEAVAPA